MQLSTINGVITQHVSVYDRGLQYGDGLFETIQYCNGKLMYWQQHYQRLFNDAAKLGIACADQQYWLQDIQALLSRTQAADHYAVKLVLTRGNSERGYAIAKNTQPNRIVQLSATTKQNPGEAGIDATFCKHRLSSNPLLAGIKHLNRLDNVIARQELGKRYHEGVVLNQQGCVVEGTMSNLFIVKAGRISTPEIQDCGVDGIVRQQLIKLSKKSDRAIEIKSVQVQDVLDADELFFSNSLAGVFSANRIDKKCFQTQATCKHLRQQLNQCEQASDNFYALHS